MYKLENVFYGCFLNKSKSQKDSLDLYRLFESLKDNIGITISEDYTEIAYPENKSNIFTSIGYSYNFKDSMYFGIMPPRGPIPTFTKCAICDHIGPQYHDTSCEGSDEYLIVEEKSKFSKRIKEKFPNAKDDDIIMYKDLYPPRGIQMMETEKISRLNFPNLMELKYLTNTGNTIVIKIDRTKSMSIINVPYEFMQTTNEFKFERFYKHIFEELRNKSIDLYNENSINKIFTIKGIFKTIDKDKILNNTGLYDYLKTKIRETNNIKSPVLSYSSMVDTINIKFIYNDNFKITCLLRNGGSVQLFASLEEDSAILSIEVLEMVKNYLKSILASSNVEEFIYPRTIFKGLMFETKIMNTYVPKDYSATKVAPPQPNVCRNQMNKNLKTSYIHRPVPFSFTMGEPPMKGLVIEEQGVQSKNDEMTINGKPLYVPCCTSLTGTYKSTKKTLELSFEKYVKSPSVLKDLASSLDASPKEITNEKKLKEMVDESIEKLTSTKQVLFRRLMYGFPNDKYEEDDGEKYNISKKDTKDKYCGVYIPGTQDPKFGGDGRKIRDSRIFKGLLDEQHFKPENKDVVKKKLLDIVKSYCDTKIRIIDNKLIPIHSNNIELFKENKTKMMFQYIQVNTKINKTFKPYNENDYNNYIESGHLTNQLVASFENKTYIWYPKISDDYMKYASFTFKVLNPNEKNLIQLRTPTGTPKKIEDIEFYKEDYLFVPASVSSKVSTGKVYLFVFNHFLDESKVGIIPNQPFLYVDDDEIPELDTDESIKNKIDVVFNPVDISSFS